MSHYSDARVARWEHFRHGADIGIRGIGPSTELAVRQLDDGSWIAQCVVDV